MRVLLLLIGLNAFDADADLYRWVDRESGSVKFSNTPPPWFGDPERQRDAPAVEVIPYRGSAAPPKAATSEVSPQLSRAELERRWRSALQRIAAIAERPEPERNLAQLQEALRTAGASGASLNQIDPGGSAARDRELQATMERTRRGFQAAR